ncbi:MAG TPA: methyltransferase domain-containing protein [Ktedonobacteraceae bacterium]|nr:methyltransferase domain-containing protein [Ktedonobacteraceae bacterium]
MSAPHNPSQQGNLYIIDAGSGPEWVRQMDMNQLITRQMGGPFPQHHDVSHISRVLDLACGPGGWVLDVAFAYPSIEVVGIDISEAVIRYGQSRAKVQRLDNAYFHIMDLLQPFDIPDDSFDVINARFLSSLLPASCWLALLQECHRITRPGGSIYITEMELNLTNGSASGQLFEVYTQAIKLAGYGFSPNRVHLGLTPMLAHFLHEACYQDITPQAHLIDFSTGTKVHEAFSENLRLLYQLIQPFIIKMGVATAEELNLLHEQATLEMFADDFCAWNLLISVFGTKP